MRRSVPPTVDVTVELHVTNDMAPLRIRDLDPT